IGAILAHSTAPGVADRVAGWQRIHQKGKALLLALNHINPREPWSSGVDSLPKYAAELYQNMPQNAGVELVATRAGGLLLSTELASIKRSTQDWTLAVQARTTQLTHRGIALLMSGLTHEYAVLAKLTHRGRRSTQTVELGRVDTAVGGFTQAALQFGYQFTGRLSGDIFARYNDQTLDSSYFRVLGTRDSAGVDLDYTLSARDSVSLRAQGLRYQSHWNDFLGTGWSIDTNFRRALKVGQSYEVDAYTGLSYVHNNLVRTLPLRVAARLPTGSGPTTLLAPNFGFAGVGLALSRGMPGTDYPTVGGLRYHADLGLGYVWPDDRIGVAFTGSVGHRILGSDELSAFFHFDQTQNETGGTNLMVGVQYRYFLGK
ncbi:MAG TPA: hypothetical protein VFQ88_00270, partial [Nevskiaceae bacterium]|nr:hypothetical protein [Nevskiaceae bacterium]